MAPNRVTPLESILSIDEIAAVEYAEKLYAAKAKTAAANLLELLNLREESRNEFLGSLGLCLEDLDFEKRREVAASFMGLTAVISEKTEKSPANGHEVKLSLIDSGSATEEASEPSIKEEVPTAAEAAPLTHAQKHWLQNILSEEDIVRLEELPVSLRLEFANRLSERYQSLKIARLNAQAKRNRAEQMITFIEGRNFKEVSELTGVSYSALAAGMYRMAESIHKRVPKEEVSKLIPTGQNLEHDGS